MLHKIKSIFITLLLAGLLVACTSPKFPYGTYVNGAGSTELHFKPDGTFTVNNSGTIDDQGTFSIQGSQFTWETSSYCDPGGKATYTWTYQNPTLVLKINGTDPCPDRRSGIDGIEYRLKP